ncbi:MAG: glycosyltransferase family 2 protein [Burkholderiaceae bacterium]|nr:glycosyltransferase family 2 protein [Burkholderiaceae bacterium]
MPGPQTAPIALFVFDRPEHTRRCLDALARNPEFSDSPLFVFSDGSRQRSDLDRVEAVRRLVHQWPHPAKTIHEAPANRGLAASVIAGVTQLCHRMGRAIVVEDDLVTAPTFLAYMNHALDHYRDDAQVMQISGHMYPVEPAGTHDAVFLPLATSWGWATWERAWRHFDPDMTQYEALRRDPQLRRRFDADGAMPYFTYLERQRKGQADSWFIRWYLSLFHRRGLVLYPRRSLVRNLGFDGSGVHCGHGGSPYDPVGPLAADTIERLPPAALDQDTYAAVRRYLAAQNTFVARAMRRLRLPMRPRSTP